MPLTTEQRTAITQLIFECMSQDSHHLYELKKCLVNGMQPMESWDDKRLLKYLMLKHFSCSPASHSEARVMTTIKHKVEDNRQYAKDLEAFCAELDALKADWTKWPDANEES